MPQIAFQLVLQQGCRMKKVLSLVILLLVTQTGYASIFAIIDGDGSGYVYGTGAEFVTGIGYYWQPESCNWYDGTKEGHTLYSSYLKGVEGAACEVGMYKSAAYILGQGYGPIAADSGSHGIASWGDLFYRENGSADDWWGTGTYGHSRFPDEYLVQSGGAPLSSYYPYTDSYFIDASNPDARERYCDMLYDDLSNRLAWDSGIGNIMTDDWQVASNTTPTESVYLDFIAEVTETCHSVGLKHYPNCGLQPGLPYTTSGSGTVEQLSFSGWYSLAQHCDGVVIEYPTTNVASPDALIRFKSQMEQLQSYGCKAFLLPSDATQEFLAGVCCYFNGAYSHTFYVSSTLWNDNTSWHSWDTDHGARIYQYDDFDDDFLYAQFEDGYWLKLDFDFRTVEWTDYDPR
jgi:hypothetical protein